MRIHRGHRPLFKEGQHRGIQVGKVTPVNGDADHGGDNGFGDRLHGMQVGVLVVGMPEGIEVVVGSAGTGDHQGPRGPGLHGVNRAVVVVVIPLVGNLPVTDDHERIDKAVATAADVAVDGVQLRSDQAHDLGGHALPTVGLCVCRRSGGILGTNPLGVQQQRTQNRQHAQLQRPGHHEKPPRSNNRSVRNRKPTLIRYRALLFSTDPGKTANGGGHLVTVCCYPGGAGRCSRARFMRWIALSMVKLAVGWRGGNSRKVCRKPPTTCCMGTNNQI